MNKKIKLAQAMTGSTEEEKVIMKEYLENPVSTMMNECKVLDSLIEKHNQQFDKGWEQMKIDFISVAAGSNIDEATMFMIYMEYLNREKKTA